MPKSFVFFTTRRVAVLASRLISSVLFILFVPWFSVSAQSLIRVPQDVPTVQAGVDSAADGDTVLVGEGTYTENIVVRKKIILTSLYARDKDTSHISRTILDGSSPRNADSAAVVTFDVGTDTSSVLMGFTIRGGKGNLRGSYRVGGGIDIFSGGARIVRNSITNNTAANATYASGGGISIWNPFATANIPYVIIESNVISNNTIQGVSADGAGIALTHPGRIAGNVIERNEAGATNSSNGGGIIISGAVAVEVVNNIIAMNRSLFESGAFAVTAGAQVAFVNNTIVYNSSRGAEGGRVTQATIRMMNNILWNPGDGAEIAVADWRTLAGEYYAQNNLIRSNFYGDNINVDPAFTDTIGFTLSSGSPCISRGVDTATLGGMLVVAPSTDIHGNIRPNSTGSKPDLGAVESAFETSSPFPMDPQQWLKTMVSQGRTRLYSLFLPKSYSSATKLPLLIALTGAGLTYEFGVAVGLQNIADKEGFVLVSPEPFMKAWTSGNNANLQSLEDVIFISELLDSLIVSYKIDTNRVYLCGLSSGAFLSYRAAAHLSDRITAIGTVAGTMPSLTAQANPPTHPVAVVMFNGTSDPGVPYGGKPPYQQSVDSTIIKWRRYNDCSEWFQVQNLPDLDPDDGATVTKFIWRDCTSGQSVVLYRINGGAHNWPGLVLPLPQRPLTMDIFASAEIFEFFTNPVGPVFPTGTTVSVLPARSTLDRMKDTVLVTVKIADPQGLSFSVEFESPDESPVDSLELFDDGAHDDSLANDGVFANTWIPGDKSTYSLDLKMRVQDTLSFRRNNVAVFSLVTSVLTRESEQPGSFHLSQNFPNPFNPSTKIGFKVQASGFTSLKVFDLLGREVATLVNEELRPGSYEATWDAVGFPTGVYFYRLIAGSFAETKRLILLR